MSRTKRSTRLTLSCNFTSQIKEHLGWNAAGTFPSHCDFLEPRHENPPSLLNRTILGAAYSPARRRIISPPNHAQFLVDHIISYSSYALCSSWFSPEKAYSQYIKQLHRCVRSSPLRHSLRYRYPPYLCLQYSSAPRVRRALYSTYFIQICAK